MGKPYILDPIEKAPREEIERIQLKRLKETVRRAYENVPIYRRKFQEAGITPDDIRSLEDLRKIPFTYKNDLREAYPYGMFAVPLSEVIEIHASSGTTGKPTVVGYTATDIENWSNLMARSFAAAGVTKDDILYVALGYHWFTGGLGFHYGGQKLGAMVVPAEPDLLRGTFK